MTKFKIKSFYELSHDELFQVFKLRVDIFVVEQQCPYPEIDEVDRASSTLHIVLSDDAVVKAYARCYLKSNDTAAIGRVLISPAARGGGIAYTLMEKAIESCQSRYAGKQIEISAQTYLQTFYQKLGFKSIGEAYLEDGIEHIDMQYIQ
ncbi:GNAT family N-acetyltransferase [Pseudoalteromonas luteoviolacea]|uniref:GNAT family N-acetyltransferase n=1 Tax=Pseudoalteromonas luteoviolacea TaxID=43657 RepID=UPI001EEE87F5|nr:GNAT family N-acetyltransferase [Pseudoalteromonas luteoviolacea]MCF6437918.1 GNAT family N-acetyltransferase [Pseudoalteromonas luteoviolacea]